MGLFKRKPIVDDAPRCPSCAERVPDGAVTCAMCGHDLAELRAEEPAVPAATAESPR